MRRQMLLALVIITSLLSAGSPAQASHGNAPRVAGRFTHLVVLYQENHSFDNLYGTWDRVGWEPVDGLRFARHTTQVGQDGTPYKCLPQMDVNLTSPPLPATCDNSAFTNRPFLIDDYLKPADKTCPAPGVFAPNGVLKDSPGAEPGGCTRDLVHRFYQEQYQIDGGKQDRYVTGSDATGLTMGHYDSKGLPIYRYLHEHGHPNYVIADRFFQGAFGGSFLNHQYLIAARAPIHTAPDGLHSIVDANGFPNASYPLYHPATAVKDAQLTQACGPEANPNVACGDYAVNTIQPTSTPHGGGPQLPLIDDTKYPNIGDRLSDAGVSWAWYAGGWNDAEAGHPGPLFQYHHQPFNYFAAYAPGQPGRAHLKDETEFIASAKNGTLPSVSFVKPYGAENEHPGYASEPNGNDHLVELLKAVENGPQARDTLVVVTYDENGGQWDHVSPPVVDKFGPGTRLPTMLVSKAFFRSGVDHTVYDTTSIMATLERSLRLDPVDTRDARVNDLSRALHGFALPF